MANITINGLTAGTIASADELEYQIAGAGASRKTTAAGIVTAGGGLSNPMTTAGDIIRGGAAGVPTRLGIGANGQVLTLVTGIPAWANASGVALSNTSAWTKNQYVAPVALTISSGLVAVDASLSNNFTLSLTANATISNPTNLQSGMVLNFCIDEDATGGRTIAFGTLFKWPGGTVPTFVTTANAKNFVSAYYDGTILRCNGSAGFA